MWSPSCILEQSRFQPAILQDQSVADCVRHCAFIGVAILWVPIASARVVRSTVLRGGGGASSALIAPAGLIGAAIGVLDHGGDPCRWRHHSSRSPSFAFASLNFILKTINPCWAAGVPLRPAPTRRLRSQLLTPSTRCTTDVPTPMVRPIFTLPHALGVQLRGRRGNAANGVPGEGRRFQLQSGQGRQRTTARPAFADTHASSTAGRNSLHRSHGLGKRDRAYASRGLFR